MAPSTVRRSRLERWLATHVAVPLRMLVAPAGSGKSTLLLKYLPNSTVDTGYCAIPSGASIAAFVQLVGTALALPQAPHSYDELIDALRSAIVRPTELALDDVDNASPEVLALLKQIVEDAPEHLTFIYTSRSRDAIDAKTWVARGLGVLCDHRRLAFDPAETELLAETCGVPCSHLEIGRLLEESEGWAIVVSGAVRAAAEDSRSLNDAYEHWRVRYGQVFTEFIAADLDRAPEEDRALVRSLIAGATIDDQERLHRLEAQGLFVVADNDDYRPYRPIRQLRGRVRLSPSARLSPLIVRMFGRFEAQIDNQEINWIRRRDQQFIKYLLLKPTGSATRSELASVFWPDADRQLAAQSVRTACSNIRKAIAAMVGYACVDLYFKADPDVSLDLTNVVADVRRFSAHVGDGDASFDRGDVQEAAVHYRAAEELYSGRLLDGDPPEAWFGSHAQVLEEQFVIVLERLAQTAFDEGDMKSASEYAFRVQKIRPDATGLVKMLGRIAPPYGGTPASLEEHRRKRSSA
ncbi:MAG TPA: BTAD domain-containing putative transcriptional regulator [Candidatus Baltobacteraceae bacterium]